jgi:hypothetical protein
MTGDRQRIGEGHQDLAADDSRDHLAAALVGDVLDRRRFSP